MIFFINHVTIEWFRNKTTRKSSYKNFFQYGEITRRNENIIQKGSRPTIRKVKTRKRRDFLLKAMFIAGIRFVAIKHS